MAKSLMGAAAPTSAKRVAAAQRAERVLDMKVRGFSASAIATKEGISRQRVWQIITAELEAGAKRRAALADTLAEIEFCRLERVHNLMDPLMEEAETVKERVAAGRLVVNASAGRRRLCGLDKAEKHEFTGADGKPLIPGSMVVSRAMTPEDFQQAAVAVAAEDDVATEQLAERINVSLEDDDG
jgi:hypothetical protein